MNGNNQKTFGEFLAEISHEKHKHEKKPSLSQKLNIYIQFCADDIRFLDVKKTATKLQKALISGASEEIDYAFADFQSFVNNCCLIDIEPLFLFQDIISFETECNDVALLFNKTYALLKDVMESILDNKYPIFNKKSHRQIVKNLGCTDWLICDASTASKGKSSGCKLGKVIVMDFTAPEAGCCDHFLQLPVHLSELQQILKRESE